MKPHRIALFALAGLFSLGCRSGVNQQLLERELRLQEDQIYALEDELDEYEAQLESVQYENSALKRQLSTGDRGALDSPSAPMIDLPGNSSPAPRRSAPRNMPGNSMPNRSMPSSPGSSDDPMVEPGVEIDPGEEFDPSTSASGASASRRVTDRVPQRIVLNKQLTGGFNHHGRGGDQGVLVVFEPRNKAGQMLDVAGDISIAVLDTQKQGPQARIARWDFTPEEAQQFFGKTALGRGYHIELPWPGEPPTNRKLQLFVRFVTADGRKLMADMPIDISPPTDREAKRWRGVPAGSRRSQSMGHGTAPPYQQAPYQSTAEPTAKFLDPPAIVPESESIRLPDARVDDADASSDDGPDLSSADERAAKRKKRADAKSARPTWSPYR